MRKALLFLAATGAVSLASASAEAAPSPYVSVLGWEGDHDAAIAFADGSFSVRDGVAQTVSFGISTAATPLDWANAGGYLPALATTFDKGALHVAITSFGDKVNVGGADFVVVYSRVAIKNTSAASLDGDPAPSTTPGLVSLTPSAAIAIPAGQTVNHDYAIVVDRFGAATARPTDLALAAAGSWDAHYQHIEQYWNDRLSKIVDVRALPDKRLIDAYKAGFIITHIIKDGFDLNVGENGYDVVYDHDLIGILNSLFVLGDFQDAKALLGTMSRYVYEGSTFHDASWKFSQPWATYLQKTGDLALVTQNFDTIKARTHLITKDRTGPGGILRKTSDIDADGYWTTDNWAALLGLASYKYVADAVGDTTESAWAITEYDSLFKAIDDQIASTVAANKLNYIPCSPLAPNDANRCAEPTDGNWMAISIIGSWAWDGYLWGARQEGTMLDLVDPTYDYGFGRLKGKVPPHTYGGYPGYGTSYNAGYGLTGLRGNKYRTEALLDYVFMLDNGQSGPHAWWEGEIAPRATAWKGTHPAAGSGSCPHAWGQSFAFRALVDSLIAEKGDGTVIVGRGLPAEWMGKPIEIANVPVAKGKRMGFVLGGTAIDVTLSLNGDPPMGPIRFDLPAFKGRICSATAGTVHSDEGYLELPATVTDVTVHLGDGCVDIVVDAGSGGHADAVGDAPGAVGSDRTSSSCSCRAAGLGAAASFTGLAPALLVLLWARRRRRG